MHHIADKYYDMVDEYADETETPVTQDEYDALAAYFELLLTHLSNNEEISESTQHEIAAEAGIHKQRIDDIAMFLNRWGNE
ncbi:DUF2543 family protein [Tatumella punctata]|uniref:DUF2543 family protein n=1 Tax=Tatumella punctata TaxID=399969 RepID=A0ABW1VUE5_9GAMM